MNTVAPLENDVDARVFMDPSDTDSQYEITEIASGLFTRCAPVGVVIPLHALPFHCKHTGGDIDAVRVTLAKDHDRVMDTPGIAYIRMY